MATKKSKTRRKRGGKNWNCTCKLADAGVVAAAKSSVGTQASDAAKKIQTAARAKQKQASDAAKKIQVAARAKQKQASDAKKKLQKDAAEKIQAIRRGVVARKTVAAIRTQKGTGGGRRRKTRKMSRRRRRR